MSSNVIIKTVPAVYNLLYLVEKSEATSALELNDQDVDNSTYAFIFDADKTPTKAATYESGLDAVITAYETDYPKWVKTDGVAKVMQKLYDEFNAGFVV